jgi:hypothetical protein
VNKTTAKEISAAFGNLCDAALAGLAGATRDQVARIEQFILMTCYPLHVENGSEPTKAMVDVGAHVLSEWLDDDAPLHERRYRDPAVAAYKQMRAIDPSRTSS